MLILQKVWDIHQILYIFGRRFFMEKKLGVLGGMLVLILVVMTGCGKNSKLTKVTFDDGISSVSYAPLYVAIEKGYFEDEKIDLILEHKAQDVSAITVIESGEVDMGVTLPGEVMNGIEGDIENDTQQEMTDPLIVFASLPKSKDSNLQVGVADENGEITYYDDYDMSCTANESCIDGNVKVLGLFSKALERGRRYLVSHSIEDIAEIIQPYVPETERKQLESSIQFYCDQNKWRINSLFSMYYLTYY